MKRSKTAFVWQSTKFAKTSFQRLPDKDGFFMPKTPSKKDQFYITLHEDIAKMVRIDVSQIKLIRGLVLGEKKTRKEAAEWFALQLPFIRSEKKKRNYQSALNFCASALTDDWNHVVMVVDVVF